MPCRWRTHSGALLLVEVRDHLGVALGREAVAARAQLVAQLAEVVDLAVEHDDDRAVLVGDRLIAGDEVDDSQPLDAETDAVVEKHAPRVRPAMLERGAHPLQQLPIHRPCLRRHHLSDDPTHR